MYKLTIHVIIIALALILGLSSFIMNARASRKFLSGHFKAYITLKFYGEFFMMFFLISYLFSYLMQVFSVQNDLLINITNFLGLLFIIVSFIYFLLGSFSLKKMGDLFGFAK